MGKKKVYLVVIILTLVSVISVGTFALITWTSANNTEISVKIGDLAEVYYYTSQDIDISNIGPIFNYETDAEMSSFSVAKVTDTELDVSVKLNITSISSNLKDETFKYILTSSTDNVTYTKVKEGNFSEVSSGDTLTLVSDSLENILYFKLYIFIDGNYENPISMQGGSLEATIILGAEEAISRDISITKFALNNTAISGIPQTGLYNMTSTCSNLSYNSFTKEIEISGGTVPLECEVNFTENTNYPLLNTMQVGDYVAYVGNNGCNNGVAGTTGTGAAEAGNSCKGENANQSTDTSGYTYGYCYSDDYKYYVYGWRIAYIENNKVYLTSAGSPECINKSYATNPVQTATNSKVTMGTSTIYYATNYTYNSSTGKFSLDQSSTITSGKYSSVYSSVNNYYTCKSTSQTATCTTLYRIQSYNTGNYANVNTYSNMSLGNADHISKLNTAALDYCNATYADGGTCSNSNTWAMGNTDFQKITNAISGTTSNLTSEYGSTYCLNSSSIKRCGYNNDLIDNGGYYWFAAYYTTSSSSGVLWLPSYRCVFNDSYANACGFRPIISLSSNVYVTGGSGTMDDPYTIGI